MTNIITDTDKIEKILVNHDPQGLIRMGAPVDEYRHEAELIEQNFLDCKDEKVLAKLIYSIFVTQFNLESAGTEEDYLNIAKDIFAEINSPNNFDRDLILMDRQELDLEVRKLRAMIRRHRDSSGHDLCWYWPEMWKLLPEEVNVTRKVPPKNEFLDCCAKYRDSLDHGLINNENV